MHSQYVLWIAVRPPVAEVDRTTPSEDNKVMKRLFLLVSAVALFMAAAPASAQDASVGGMVKDSQGGALPGSTIAVGRPGVFLSGQL